MYEVIVKTGLSACVEVMMNREVGVGGGGAGAADGRDHNGLGVRMWVVILLGDGKEMENHLSVGQPKSSSHLHSSNDVCTYKE